MLAALFHRDISIRAVGAALLATGVACFRVLFGGHVAPESWPGMAAAAIAFLASSSGAALTVLGMHIHDQVEVARPWASGRSFVRRSA